MRYGDGGPRGEAAGRQLSAVTLVVLWSICWEMGGNAPVCPTQQPPLDGGSAQTLFGRMSFEMWSPGFL